MNFSGISGEVFQGNSQEFLRGKIPEKSPGISWNLLSYLILLKIRKHGDQDLRISQEFPEKYSREILRNFWGEKFQRNSREFLETNSIIEFP